MTAAQAHKELEALLNNKKRKLGDLTKEALEYVLAMIVRELGKEALAKE